MSVNPEFWSGKKVLITGHTGFKGGWLSIWLKEMGAVLTGLSLPPNTAPSLFECARVEKGMTSVIGDIRDYATVKRVFDECHPEIIFHMAAQPLVRLSYEDPLLTYTTNVIGTANILEATRHSSSVRSVVNVTTDKCYENREWVWGYRENDPMGGYDPYSSSKGCAELLTNAYRHSFFSKEKIAVATARAGNVIGGGDWSKDRLIPDIFSAFDAGRAVTVRNPHAIRPWQHVLEPLSGYLMLAEKLSSSELGFDEAWNFGPQDDGACSVQVLLDKIINLWGDGASWVKQEGDHPHEASYLKLDISKARTGLMWEPKWNLDKALEKTVIWHKAWRAGEEMDSICLGQISDYFES